MTRSQFGFFCAGVAVGAVGRAFYPQIKEQVCPLLAGAGHMIHKAYTDALRDAADAAASMQDVAAGKTPGTAPETGGASEGVAA